MSSWQIVMLEPARSVLAQISLFLVNTLLVLIILFLGWLIAKVVKTLVIKGLQAIKIVERVSELIELDSLLEKGGITYSVSELIGVICYWSILLVTFVVALNAIGLTVAAGLLDKVVMYIPNVIAAIFILVMGMFVAALLRNIVQAAANNAGLSQTKLLSKVVEVAVMVFAIIVALEQLNVGIRVTELTLSIILGSIGLAAALAFGLGCKDIAGRLINDLVEKLKKK